MPTDIFVYVVVITNFFFKLDLCRTVIAKLLATLYEKVRLGLGENS